MNQATDMRSSTPRDAALASDGLGFSLPVPAGGYRWWYVDGFSDCGQFVVTVIAFIGSVFSPYYFRSRSRGATPAEEHVSLNVILYGPSKSRWCMTERGAAALDQSSSCLSIGPSAVHLTDTGVTIQIDERATPFGQRVQGTVQLRFQRAVETCFELDDAGEHWWWLRRRWRRWTWMARPALKWAGSAYMDSNFGARPIETDSHLELVPRTPGGEGCQIHHDTQLAGGGSKHLSLSIDEAGALQRETFPALILPKGPIWRVERPSRLPASERMSIKTLEDTPFYTRSQIRVNEQEFMHESLDLRRFCQPWVQTLLPFRMPRVA